MILTLFNSANVYVLRITVNITNFITSVLDPQYTKSDKSNVILINMLKYK